MSTGEGKGWAEGKTAATDQRIARAAAAHRGKIYQRHLSPEQDRRHRHGKVLRYGKAASLAVLDHLYRDRTAPCLLRKRAIYEAYRSPRHL